MIIESLVASLIIGKLRGGRIGKVSSLEISKWYLFIFAFIIEFALLYLYEINIVFFEQYFFYFHLFSYFLFFVGFIFNLKNPWLIVAFLGTILNTIAIFLNGGKMPVSVDALTLAGLSEYAVKLTSNQVATHQVLTKNMTAWYLGDVLPLIPPYPFPKVISIGDIIITMGVFFMIQRAMKKKDTIFT